jgi:general secretion pathway protein H
MRERLQRHGGFTLIELLVVLVIIGIIISSAVLSFSSGDISAQMNVETRRIYALINLAREEAILQGEEMSLTVEADRYGFEIFSDNAWEPMSSDKMFRNRALQVGMEIALVVDNAKIDLSTKTSSKDILPPARIYFLSSGEMTPFELILRSSDETVQYRIRAGEDGKMEILTPGELS